MSRKAIFLALSITGAAWLAGCAVGPNYKRPNVDSTPAFRDDANATNASFADLNWWQVYQDSVLQTLVQEAFTNNYDLRIAMSRVEQSRALAAQARSAFFPSVNYNGAVSQGRNYEFGEAYPTGGASHGSALTYLNAFWEVDLWGRIRRLNESARAQFLASEEDRRYVRLSLLSDVATAYFQLLELDKELELEAFQRTNGGRIRIGPGNLARRSGAGRRRICDSVHFGADGHERKST
jgi:multidrug efflux system outer membrane protein